MTSPALAYFKKCLTSYQMSFDWVLEQVPGEENFTLRIFVPLVNQDENYFQDKLGKSFDRKKVLLEDRFLFTPDTTYNLPVEDYLAVVLYDYKNGMQKGFIDEFVRYLRMVVNLSQTEFSENIDTVNPIHFEIRWNQNNFNQRIKMAQETSRFNYGWLTVKTEENND